MSKCLSKRCKQDVQAGWSFCPMCGVDNRPNEFRPTIMNCAHKYVGPRRYCVVCGEGYGGAKTAAATTANIRFGVMLMVVGAVLIAASFAVRQIMATGNGPGYQWIQSWYGSSISLPGGIVLQGTNVPTYALATGAALLFFGFLGTVAAKANKPRAKKKSSSSPKTAV